MIKSGFVSGLMILSRNFMMSIYSDGNAFMKHVHFHVLPMWENVTLLLYLDGHLNDLF